MKIIVMIVAMIKRPCRRKQWVFCSRWSSVKKSAASENRNEIETGLITDMESPSQAKEKGTSDSETLSKTKIWMLKQRVVNIAKPATRRL